MSSPVMLCKNNESGMRECDECWKGRSEVQSTWEKIYILLYKPDDSIYTSRMKFRYIEDYKKMRRISKMLYKIVKMMDNNNQPTDTYERQRDFIYKLYEETRNLEKLVKKCNFFNIDYDDGKVFVNKFWSINTFLANGKRIKSIFGRLLRVFKYYYDDLYYILKKEICPSLKKNYHELLRRGMLDLD